MDSEQLKTPKTNSISLNSRFVNLENTEVSATLISIFQLLDESSLHEITGDCEVMIYEKKKECFDTGINMGQQYQNEEVQYVGGT